MSSANAGIPEWRICFHFCAKLLSPLHFGVCRFVSLTWQKKKWKFISHKFQVINQSRKYSHFSSPALIKSGGELRALFFGWEGSGFRISHPQGLILQLAARRILPTSIPGIPNSEKIKQVRITGCNWVVGTERFNQHYWVVRLRF